METPEVDQISIDHIGRPADEAWQEAEALAADTRYSHEHKQETIKQRTDEAAAEVESRYREYVAEYEAKKPGLTEAAKMPQMITPTPEEAPMLLYLRQTLESEDIGTLRRVWGEALESQDKPLARVARDLVRANRRHENPTWQPDARYTELSDRTDDLLAPPEVLKARQELAKLEQTRLRVNGAYQAAKQRLTGWRLNNDGLMDGRVAAITRSINF